MVLAAATGEPTARPARADAADDGANSRGSRSSRAARRKKQRGGGWYCCPCTLTALRGGGSSGGGGGGGGPCGGGRGGGPEEGGLWPAPAKFYCCRADLVAAMARERANNNDDSKASRSRAAMDAQQQQGRWRVDDDDDDDDILDFDEVAEEALPDATFREVFDRSHQQDHDERWQVSEPDLPYVENLPHQLDVGRVIVIDGVVLPDAVGFAVNLSCGAGENPDIAFHLNPRLDRCYVARNSRSKGNWGEEEGACLGGSPFKRGRSFLIHILVTATAFKVSVDRMHICSFQFRMAVSKICRLEIHGDVIISAIRHTRIDVYPERSLDALPEHTFFNIPTDHAVPWSVDMPDKENLYIGQFKPNLSAGMEITIRGRMKLLPQSFYVNLQQGCQLWPHPNVHFHLNPRFAAEDSEHVVIVNGWMRGSWGNEQKYNRCRFRPGEPFTIVIFIEDQRYRVMVDGLQQAAMFHRAPVSLVDTLVVRGDVFINHVGIAKSGPAPERLPSPGSPSESLSGSFVHIAEEETDHALSQCISSREDKVSLCQEVTPVKSDHISSGVNPPTVFMEAPSTSTPNKPSYSGERSSTTTSESITCKSSDSDCSPQNIPQETQPVESERSVSVDETLSAAQGSRDSSKSDIDKMVRSEENKD